MSSPSVIWFESSSLENSSAEGVEGLESGEDAGSGGEGGSARMSESMKAPGIANMRGSSSLSPLAGESIFPDESEGREEEKPNVGIDDAAGLTTIFVRGNGRMGQPVRVSVRLRALGLIREASRKYRY